MVEIKDEKLKSQSKREPKSLEAFQRGTDKHGGIFGDCENTFAI